MTTNTAGLERQASEARAKKAAAHAAAVAVRKERRACHGTWAPHTADCEAAPVHDLSAWNCREPYDGMTYAHRNCAACEKEDGR